MKLILDLCGGSGAWSRPYYEAGYSVKVITLPTYNLFDTKLEDRKLKFFNTELKNWEEINCKDVYGILAAPTCTHFSLCRTNAKTPRDLETAMKLVIKCLQIIWYCQYELPTPNSKLTNLKFWALENPNGFLKYFLGNPPLEFSPYEYGDDYKKKTHIWGNFNIPPKQQNKCDNNKFDQTLMKDLVKKHPTWWTYDKGCGLTYRAALRSITSEKFAQAFYEANK